jgi:sugar lactone lactonase YvrE
MDGLNFANGVAISNDQQFLLINELGHYRILKYWLEGPNAGTTEIILDNLPGFPDNVNNGLNGRFWIGLVAPRNKMLDDLSGSPFMRKMVQRLPAFVRPKAVPSSHVIAIDGDGNVLMNLHDTEMRFPALTGVFESSQSLYLTTLFGNQFGRLDKQDLP